MTNDHQLPDQLVALIREHIHSIEALEVLLLLRRSEVRHWSVEELSAELSSSERDIASAAAQLVGSQLASVIRSDSVLRYVYKAPLGLAGAIADLERLYHSDRLEVVQTVASGAISRLRNGARKAFPGLSRRSEGKKDE